MDGHKQTEPRGDLSKLRVRDRRQRYFTGTEARQEGQKQRGLVPGDQSVEERWADSHKSQSGREGVGGRSLNAELISDAEQVSGMTPRRRTLAHPAC